MSSVKNKEFKVEIAAKILFKRKCNYLIETITEITSQFVKNEQDIEEEHWTKTGDATDLSSEDFEYHSKYLEELLEKHKHLPQILYKSIIVSIYSLLETAINDIIKCVEYEVPKKIKFKHLRTKGSEIENFINFLELVHNLDFETIKPCLNKLKPFADLRNNIVHKNGNLKYDNDQRVKNIMTLASQNSSMEIIDEEVFFKNNLILFQYLKIVESFGYKFFDLVKITNTQ